LPRALGVPDEFCVKWGEAANVSESIGTTTLHANWLITWNYLMAWTACPSLPDHFQVVFTVSSSVICSNPALKGIV
jgi:hypothetical protein